MPPPLLSTGSHLRFGLVRIRVVDGTVYSPHDDGIYATKVSGGSPTLVMPYPAFSLRPDAPPQRWMFRDFWIDREAIVAVIGKALFTAPLTGGPPTLLPGYSMPSTEGDIVDREWYERAGPYIYATSELSTGGRGIRRHSLAGGAPADFVRFNHVSRHFQFLVASGDSLHYVDDDEPESSRPAVFVTPLHEAMPTIVPADFRPNAVVGFNGNLYVVEGGGITRSELWRRAEDGTWTKLKLPFHAAVPPLEDIRYASHDDKSYFTGFALYRAPDDLRSAGRDVIFQVRNDSDTVEIARCLPEASIDPTTPRSDVSTRILDLAVDGNALYVVSSTLDSRKFSWKDHIVEVTP